MSKPRRDRLSDARPGPKGSLPKIVAVLGTIAAFLVLFTPWQSKEERQKAVNDRVMKKVYDAEGMPEQMVERRIEIWDGAIRIKVVARDLTRLEETIRMVSKNLYRLARDLEPDYEESLVKKINDQAGIAPVEVDEPFYESLREIVRIAGESEGTVDITLKPLYDLWKMGDLQGHFPTKEELAATLPLVGMEHIRFDDEKKTVFLPEKGMGLDFRTIRRGWVLREVQRTMAERGVENYFALFGSDVVSRGKQFKHPWKISLQHPKNALDYYGDVATGDGALMITNYYSGAFIRKKKMYHPFLDPKTGRQYRNCLTAGVWGPDPLKAKIYGQAVFSLGKEAGLEFLSEKSGYEGVGMDADQNVFVSTGMKERLDLAELKNRPLPESVAPKETDKK